METEPKNEPTRDPADLFLEAGLTDEESEDLADTRPPGVKLAAKLAGDAETAMAALTMKTSDPLANLVAQGNAWAEQRFANFLVEGGVLPLGLAQQVAHELASGHLDDGAPEAGSSEEAASLTAGRHGAVKSAVAWLAYAHLPLHLRPFSRPFYEAALDLVASVPDCPELTAALNRLVEAKDWAVRAGIRGVSGRPGSVARPAELVDPPKEA